MSAQSKYMAIASLADRRHPERERIDWQHYEDLANQETDTETTLVFSEMAKSKIVEALDLMARSTLEKSQRVTLEDLKDQTQLIFSMIKDLPDQEILENPDLFGANKELEEVLLQILGHTTSSVDVEKSIPQRTRIFLSYLRNSPQDMTMHLPSSEAMAAYEIREAFKVSGMNIKIRHTRPSSIPEGCEPISAFEKFVFDFILVEVGTDSNARKILYRRLIEADKAVRSKR
ncbi:hypothetical protein [Sedimentitalea todarodis]|uniref:Uncharacterized protein n=1 Tax=Sedimentitalea todarodis TaxID=1631240 RepID=A0ABU3V9B9_9RHOB|nr:hypothetical protein [Sedimentitalea todarodis]MDU9002761.1 hypothetical protein [Sedimentitalea todarodis]